MSAASPSSHSCPYEHCPLPKMRAGWRKRLPVSITFIVVLIFSAGSTVAVLNERDVRHTARIEKLERTALAQEEKLEEVRVDTKVIRAIVERLERKP